MVDFILLLITVLVTTTSLLSFILLCDTINVKHFEKTTKAYSLKITNWFYTLFISIFYIVILVCFLYYLRVLHLGNVLDLKILYTQLQTFKTLYFTPLDLFSKCYIVVLCIISIMFVFLCYILLYKLISREMFKILVYIDGYPIIDGASGNYKPKPITAPWWFPKIAKYPDFSEWWPKHILHKFNYSKFHKIDNLLEIFIFYITTNIIKLFIMIKYIIIKRSIFEDTLDAYVERYMLVKKYFNVSLFVKISPLYFILYDCIFNNLVIVHFYYYMLFYIPIVLYKRFCNFSRTILLSDVLWLLYYHPKKDPEFFIVTTTEEETLLLLLTIRDRGMSAELAGFRLENLLMEDLTWTFYKNLYEKDVYSNMFGDLIIIRDGKVWSIQRDPDGTYQEDEQGNYICIESKEHTIW